MDTSIDQQFTNNMVVPPIFTEVLCDKLYDSPSRDIYMCCRMNLAADPVNIPAPKFVDLGISTIKSMDKGANLWTPATRFGSPTDVFHCITPDHIFGRTTEVGDTVIAKSDYNYKNYFETWR